MQITGVKSTNNAFGTSHMEFRCELLEGRDVVIGISKIVSLESGIKDQQTIREQLVIDAFAYYKNIGPKILETRESDYFEKPYQPDEDPGVVYPVAPIGVPKPSFINPVQEVSAARQAIEEAKKISEQKAQPEEKPTANLNKLHKWTRQAQGAKYAGKCHFCSGTINKGDDQSMKPHPHKEGGWLVAHLNCVKE